MASNRRFAAAAEGCASTETAWYTPHPRGWAEEKGSGPTFREPAPYRSCSALSMLEFGFDAWAAPHAAHDDDLGVDPVPVVWRQRALAASVDTSGDRGGGARSSSEGSARRSPARCAVG